MPMAKVLHNTLSKTFIQTSLALNKKLFKPQLFSQNTYYSKDTKYKSPPGNLVRTSKNDIEKSLQKIKEIKAKTKKRRNIKITKLILATSGICFIYLGYSLVLILGAPEMDVDGKSIKDDLSDEHVIKQYIIRTYRELEFYAKLTQVPLNEKLLPDPLEYPYLQPKYTLVLELSDVLVHSEWKLAGGWKYKKRPMIDYFLQSLKDSYEIIIYTAEQGKIAFPLTDAIDPKNTIAYKLVRSATYFTGTNHVKKLNNLNRDLSKVICIDWNAKHVKFNPENLLRIKRWSGNDDDTSLLDLTMFLKTIADNEIEDVREVLAYYSRYDDPVAAFREKQEKLIEELEEEAATKKVNRPFKITSPFKL